MNSTIRYKGYCFEHNPETLRITGDKTLSSQTVLRSTGVISEICDNSRVITGEGKIHGENCIYRFMKLFQLKEETGSGILSLPGIKPFYAFFSSLEFSADPTPELISYKFVFKEDSEKRRSVLAPEEYYTLESDEDLWDVSCRFNIPIETLAALNPELKRPDETEKGYRVRIC